MRHALARCAGGAGSGEVSYDFFMWPGRVTRVDPRPLLPYVLTLAALIVLATSTVLLARAYHAEREHLAAEHFSRGIALRRAGAGQDAIPHLRMALSLERHNDAYTLALAETLIRLDRPAEAATYLTEVLRRDPTSGIANLQRARIALALDQPAAAETYYQRAIYGSWPIDRSPTVPARFELADLLLSGDAAARARARAVVSELRLSAPQDSESRRRIARLLLAVELPEEAAAELRGVVAANPEDAEAWALLSAAEMARENYAGTQSAARRALELEPDSPEVSGRLAFSERVLALDPTGPRISMAERRRRARRLLQEALTQLDLCTGDPALLGPEIQEARQEAATVLRSRRRTDLDSLVQLAEQLWRTRQQTCAAVESDPALLAVFGRLAAEDGR